MILVFLCVMFSFLIVFLLKLVSIFISDFAVVSREELSSYECGFEHHGLSRVPFSFRYFFLTLIFLLFDLEIILLLFFPFSMTFSFGYLSLLGVIFFVLFLFLGLLFEWKDGSLEWVM